MRFNICTKQNGLGLETDTYILKNLLEVWGHSVTIVPMVNRDQIDIHPDADINIFIELIAPTLFPHARKQWFIPNQEWFLADHTQYLSNMDKVLCKTQAAFRSFSPLAKNCTVIGFESPDLYDPNVPRKRVFLHVAGGSGYKNSESVSYAFAKFLDDRWDKDCNRDLVYIGQHEHLLNGAQYHPNIKYIKRAGRAELKHFMNECLFHILPSKAEGWGQAIHEGLSCGSVMITTDYPPMNEFSGASIFIPPGKIDSVSLGHLAWVGAYHVRDAVQKAWAMKPDEIAAAQKKAREYFLTQRESFRTKFKGLVDNA